MNTETIGQVVRCATEKNPHSNENLLRRAYRFAADAHGGQKRENGDPYITHPLAVAHILAKLGMDTATVAAGLLHDVIEDTNIERGEIAEAFGEDVAWLCEGVTKLKRFRYQGIEREVENLRKFFLAMAEDVRVVILKLADRLHNMRTLQFLPPEKRKQKAMETMTIYVPIAGRLGIWEVKAKLEDLCFPHIDPEAYAWTKQRLSQRIKKREEYLQEITPKLQRALKKESITPIDVQARAKTYWSTYEKLKRQDMDAETLYDLVAMRVIVNSLEECYAALGIVHSLWPPVPNRIKDYIATPKPNGYQTLQTTVFADDGEMTEVQIRTKKMHEEAEHGIAAHWMYVEAGKPKGGARAARRSLEWIRQLRDWQHEVEGTEEFLESLKIDFFKNRIFVFTPKGDIVDLPQGATPLDFSYYVHSEVGNHTSGAKIDGKMTSIDEPLRNGVVVDIITRNDAHPTRSWLSIAQTGDARSKIRRWLREHRQEEEEPEPSKRTIGGHSSKKQDGEDLFTLPRVKRRQKKTDGPMILIEGEQDIASTIARCCHPLPGQRIVGYATQRGSISIHRPSCRNIERGSKQRLLKATWDTDAVEEQTFRITTENRIGMLKEISAVISEAGINITDIHAVQTNTPLFALDVSLLVTDANLFESIVRKLREIPGVVDLKRS